jgi:hypothetical protein
VEALALVLQWRINNIMSPTNNTEETRLYVKILTPASFQNEWNFSATTPAFAHAHHKPLSY